MTGVQTCALPILRKPIREAVAIPAIAVPPAPSTPITANCEAPVKVKRLSKQACSTENPEATAAAPKAVPYAPTAKLTLSDLLNVARLTEDMGLSL